MKYTFEQLAANPNLPFSQRLNKFVLDWFDQNKELFETFPESQFNFGNITETFEAFTKHFQETGKVPMWYDDNYDNIFANREVNAKFRAWHDYIHVSNGFDFTLCGEIKSFNEQRKALPEAWELERMLMEAEIVGQAMHYTMHPDKPIESQRNFTIEYLTEWL